MITKKNVDGFVPNLIGRFLEGKGDQVRVSLRSVEGCGSNGKKLRKPAIVHISYFYYNSTSGFPGRRSVGKSDRRPTTPHLSAPSAPLS